MPLNQYDSLDLAWAAGFFDGEGSTVLCGQTRAKNPHLAVRVGQKDDRCLKRFQKAIGGGTIYGPYAHETCAMYRWQATGERAVAFMSLILPYLSEAKRDQFYKRLEEWESRPTRKAQQRDETVELKLSFYKQEVAA